MFGVLEHEGFGLVEDQHLNARQEIKVEFLRAVITFLASHDTQIDRTRNDDITFVKWREKFELRFPRLSCMFDLNADPEIVIERLLFISEIFLELLSL